MENKEISKEKKDTTDYSKLLFGKQTLLACIYGRKN